MLFVEGQRGLTQLSEGRVCRSEDGEKGRVWNQALGGEHEGQSHGFEAGIREYLSAVDNGVVGFDGGVRK